MTFLDSIVLYFFFKDKKEIIIYGEIRKNYSSKVISYRITKPDLNSRLDFKSKPASNFKE